jgi:hypothetical protein
MCALNFTDFRKYFWKQNCPLVKYSKLLVCCIEVWCLNIWCSGKVLIIHSLLNETAEGSYIVCTSSSNFVDIWPYLRDFPWFWRAVDASDFSIYVCNTYLGRFWRYFILPSFVGLFCLVCVQLWSLSIEGVCYYLGIFLLCWNLFLLMNCAQL